MASQEAVKRLTQRAEVFSAFAKQRLNSPIQLGAGNRDILIVGVNKVNFPGTYSGRGDASITLNDQKEMISLHIPQREHSTILDKMRVITEEYFSDRSDSENKTGTTIATKTTVLSIAREGESSDHHEIKQTVVDGKVESQFRISLYKNKEREMIINHINEKNLGGQQISQRDSGDFAFSLLWDPETNGYKLEYGEKYYGINKIKQEVVEINIDKNTLNDMGFQNLPEEIIIGGGGMEVTFKINDKNVTVTAPSSTPMDIEKSIFYEHVIIPHEIIVSE